MGLKCKISYSEAGIATVVNEEGNPSELYGQILEAVQDQELALNIWATAYTEDLGRKGEEATLEDLLRYYDSEQAIDSQLNRDEIFSVKDFMRKNGIESLDDLNQKMQSIFKPEGFLDFDENAALESGLFSPSEISELDVPKVKNILLKIEGHLTKENIEVSSETTSYEYKDSSNKTIFGTYDKVKQETIDEALRNAVEDFADKTSFDKAVYSLPYSDFVEKYKYNKKFAEETFNRFKNLKRIPLMHTTVEGDLVLSENNTLTTVRNTVLIKGNTIELEAEIDYLDEISQDIWYNNQEVVQLVLKDVEKTFLKNNIDVIGISKIVKDRGGIMFLLEKARDISDKPTHQNILEFTEAYNRILAPEKDIVVEQIPDKYKNLNVIKVFSNQNEGVLFDKFGLIKVGENLYHSVDQNADVNNIRDYIYNQVKKGEVNIPSNFVNPENMGNKPEILEGISRYLMSRDIPSQVVKKEMYSGYQVAFDHNIIPKLKTKLGRIENVKNSPEYLKGGFIIDFYQYYLEEKHKNSDVYRTVLSKVSFEDNDIIFKEKVSDIDNIKYSQELKDYLTLKKNTDMDYLLDPVKSITLEDTVALNLPEKYKNFERDINIVGNYAVTKKNNSEYLKHNNEMYRKVSEDFNTSVYLKVYPDTDPVYNDKGSNLDYDAVEANKVRSTYAENRDNTISEEETAKKEAASKSTSLLPELQKFSTLKDQSYGFSVVGSTVYAYKDGDIIGTAYFEKVNDGFGNEKVNVDEIHRGKGVGTELYLRMLSNFKETGSKFYPNKKGTKQSKSVIGRIAPLIKMNSEGSIIFKETVENKNDLLSKTKSFFNSNIEVLPLYSSKEETVIIKDIDNCE